MERSVAFKNLKPFASPEPRRHLVVIAEGVEKCGKTQFSLRKVPKPVAFLNNDRSAAYLFTKLKYTSKSLMEGLYQAPNVDPVNDDAQKVADAVRPVWKDFVADYYRALSDPAVRHVVVDNSTTMYRNARLARFGKLTQVPPVLYARVNDEMLRMVVAARAADKSVIFTARVGDEWTQPTKGKSGEKGSLGEKTGKLIRDGWKDLGFESEVTVRLEVKGTTYKATITASAYGGLGVEFHDDEITFPNIRAAVFGDEEEE
jgi:hypothetical protein